MKFAHRFVELMPPLIEDRVLYVSIEFATAVHNCACGCGSKVVTPLSPTDWKLAFDGETISLSPSIGNWSFECQSHYWIINDEVQFSKKWSKSKIKTGRKNEKTVKEKYYKRKRKG